MQKMPLVQKMWVRHCGPAGMPQLCWDLARRALAVTSASGTSVSPPQRPWAPAFSLVRLSPVTPRGQGTGRVGQGHVAGVLTQALDTRHVFRMEGPKFLILFYTSQVLALFSVSLFWGFLI